MFFGSFLTLFVAFTCARAFVIQTNQYRESDINNDDVEPRDIPLTNAKRLASGLTPALPVALRELVPSKIRQDSAGNPVKRQRACPSASPIVFPPKPETPIVLLDTDLTFPYGNIYLPFSARIFDASGDTLFVDNNGRISLFSDSIDIRNEPLPSHDHPPYSVFPYWDDLYGRPWASGVHFALTDTSVTIKYDMVLANGTIVSFTVYYTTNTPGRWYVYFSDTHAADGGSATIGAQGGGSFIQYEYNTPGSVRPGLRIALDTSCAGRYVLG